MQISHKARRGRTFHCCLRSSFLETDSGGDCVLEFIGKCAVKQFLNGSVGGRHG